MKDIDSTDIQTDSSQNSQSSLVQEQDSMNRSMKKAKMDESLEVVGISPLRTHGLPTRTKISKTREKLEKSYDAQKKIAAAAINVDEEDLENDQMDKVRNYDRLLYLMKEKLSDNSLKTREKIQILTLSPESWSRSKIIDFFNVTQYQVREARKLLEAKGILAIPDDKKGCGLADEIVKVVLFL